MCPFTVDYTKGNGECKSAYRNLTKIYTKSTSITNQCKQTQYMKGYLVKLLVMIHFTMLS